MLTDKNTRTRRQKYAIILAVLVFVILSAYVLPSILTSYTQSNELSKARTFHIVLEYNFNEEAVSNPITGPDVSIDLTVNCPRGIIVTDDEITIDALAILNTTTALEKKILSFTVGFSNSQTSPHKENYQGITEYANIVLYPENTSRFSGKGAICWVEEGTFGVGLGLTNQTDQLGENHAEMVGWFDTPITVYSNADYAQIVNNNTSIVFTFAIYALTLVGTVGIFIELWDWKPSTDNSEHDGKKSGSNSSITDSLTDKKQIVVNPDNTKQTTNGKTAKDKAN